MFMLRRESTNRHMHGSRRAGIDDCNSGPLHAAQPPCCNVIIRQNELCVRSWRGCLWLHSELSGLPVAQDRAWAWRHTTYVVRLSWFIIVVEAYVRPSWSIVASCAPAWLCGEEQEVVLATLLWSRLILKSRWECHHPVRRGPGGFFSCLRQNLSSWHKPRWQLDCAVCGCSMWWDRQLLNQPSLNQTQPMANIRQSQNL